MHLSNFRPVKRVTDVVEIFDLVRRKMPRQAGADRAMVPTAARWNGLVRRKGPDQGCVLAGQAGPRLRKARRGRSFSAALGSGVVSVWRRSKPWPAKCLSSPPMWAACRRWWSTAWTAISLSRATWFPPRGYAVEILSRADRGREMGRRAREDARRQYLRQRHYPAYEAYYRRVLETAARRRRRAAVTPSKDDAPDRSPRHDSVTLPRLRQHRSEAPPQLDSRHGSGQRRRAEHAGHDRRGPVHNSSAGGCRHARPAGHCSDGFWARSWRCATAWWWPNWAPPCPRAGGPYEYLKQIYGPKSLGRLVSFLFIWQLTFSAPLSIASGCIGLAAYAGYLWPNLRRVLLAAQSAPRGSAAGAPGSEYRDHARNLAGHGQLALLAVLLLYRRITSIGRLSKLLWGGVLLTVAWVISAGVTHFHAAQAFDFPPGAFTPSTRFFHRPGRGDADDHIRLLGLLQHLLSGGRGGEAGAQRACAPC